MSKSLFSKLYSYRENKNTSPKENYLTEIFAHCLQKDKDLLNEFLDLLNLPPCQDAIIKTQAIYEFGRPDIEINIPSTKTCVLIECKIEHFERTNQLEDYKKILLEKEILHRHLVYLTKYYECRGNNIKSINFHLLQWYKIYELINQQNSQLSKELKLYLKDEHMEEAKNSKDGRSFGQH